MNIHRQIRMTTTFEFNNLFIHGWKCYWRFSKAGSAFFSLLALLRFYFPRNTKTSWRHSTTITELIKIVGFLAVWKIKFAKIRAIWYSGPHLYIRPRTFRTALICLPATSLYKTCQVCAVMNDRYQGSLQKSQLKYTYIFLHI